MDTSVINIKSFFQTTASFFSRNHTSLGKVTLKSDRQVLSSCFNEPFWKKIPNVLQTSLPKMISRIKSIDCSFLFLLLLYYHYFQVHHFTLNYVQIMFLSLLDLIGYHKSKVEYHSISSIVL